VEKEANKMLGLIQLFKILHFLEKHFAMRSIFAQAITLINNRRDSQSPAQRPAKGDYSYFLCGYFANLCG